MPLSDKWSKGGYLDFSHLNKLKNLYTTEIYIKKQYKSSITQNHKINNKLLFDGTPLKDYVASYFIFRFCARNQNKRCGKIK